jgi:hypothetical protein
MSVCAARKGFLTLSDCGKSVTRNCANCGRGMCSEHLAAQTGYSLCLDCAAAKTEVKEGDYDPLWAHRYRNAYYTSTGFLPVYGAAMMFDRSDRMSFTSTTTDTFDDDVDRGGFGDS